MYAAAAGAEQMVQILLDAGADPKAETWSLHLVRYNPVGIPLETKEKGEQSLASALTARDIAQRGGHSGVVELLQKADAKRWVLVWTAIWCFNVFTVDRTIRFRKAATRVEPTMKRNKAGKEITFKELFGSSSFPRLRLTLELAKSRLVLPRTLEWWGFKNDGDVVWNKKPIEVRGRGGRYIRYRLSLGSFVITDARLKTPLVIKSGKGTIPPGAATKLVLADQKTLPVSGMVALSYSVPGGVGPAPRIRYTKAVKIRAKKDTSTGKLPRRFGLLGGPGFGW
jgi:hypothetical protein